MTVLAGASVSALYAAPGLGGEAHVEEQMMRAQQLRGQMGEDARHVQHLQQVARREKDVIKLNCVNDKLIQIRPQLNIADHAQLQVQSGEAGAMQEISTAAVNVHHLREAADQCIGEPLLGEESTNSVTHPPIVDPTGDLPPWGDVFEPPGYASPMN
jgi:hypothetical protein